MSDGAAHPGCRSAARRRPWRRPARRPAARAGTAALPGAGHAPRLGRPGMDRPLRLRAGTPDRDHRAGGHPVRGRPQWRLLGNQARAPPGAGARLRRHARHRRHRGVGGRLAPRPLHPRGPAARRDPVGHGRRCDLLPPARFDPAPPARPDARGRGGLQRSGGDPARHRLHRLDHAAGLRAARHGRAVPAADLDRPGCRAGGGLRRRVGVPAGELRHRRPLPRGFHGRGRTRLRSRGQPARLRVPLRVPGRAGARQRRDPGAQHDQGLPPGLCLGRPDRPVPDAGTARVPEPARRRLGRGHRAGTRAGADSAPAGDGGGHGVRPLQRCRALHPRLGRAPRRRAGGARHLPGHRPRARQPRLLQHRLLRGGDLDSAPGARPSSRSPSGSA